MPIEGVPPPFLVGTHVRLRPLCDIDVDGPYLGWFNDEQVCRHNRHHVYPYRREDAIRYIRTTESGPDLVLALETPDGVHIGNVSLQNLDATSRTADLAILVGDERYRRIGCGFEASDLMLRHGFRTMNLHRIACATSASNEGMCRLAERLGMIREGVRRKAFFRFGVYHDVVEYGILASEYRAEAL